MEAAEMFNILLNRCVKAEAKVKELEYKNKMHQQEINQLKIDKTFLKFTSNEKNK